MTIFYSILIFILGALFTSFFQVIAYRLPNHESIKGRSYCPSCHHQLRIVDIFPILGYIINKGRCHFCKETIPVSHILMEIIGGVVFTIAFLLFGFTLEFVVAIIFISVLLIESMSDHKYMIVIDRIWMIGLVPVIIIRIIQGDFLIYLLSSAVLFSILFLFAFLGKIVYKKDAFGGGDIKLYIFIGFCLTYQQGLFSLFLASLFGFIMGIARRNKMDQEIPFIPFIALGSIIAYFFGTAWLDWYMYMLGV